MPQLESLCMRQEITDRLYEVPSCEQSFNFTIGRDMRLMVMATVSSVPQVSFAEDLTMNIWDYAFPIYVQEEYPLEHDSFLQVIPSCGKATSFRPSYVGGGTMADRSYRLQSLLRSFHRNAGKVEAYVQNRASFLFNRLADVAFKDDIVEYDTEEESITARLKLENDFEVSVTRFANESEVLYSLFHGRKLLICDEMPIESLVKSLNEVVAKLARV